MAVMRRICDASERFLPKGAEGACCPVCGGGPYDFVDSRTVIPGDSALGDGGDLSIFKEGFGDTAFELGGFVAGFHCRRGCRFTLAGSWSQAGTELAWFADGDSLLPRVSMSGKQAGAISSHCRKNNLPLPWSSFPGDCPGQFYDIEDARDYISAIKSGKPLPVGGKSRAFALYPPRSDEREKADTKKCAKCGRDLPLSEYNKAHGSIDGLMRVCRVCEAENNAIAEERRKKKKEEEAERRAAAEASLPAMPRKPDTMRPACTGVPKVAARASTAGGSLDLSHPIAPVLSSIALTSEARAALSSTGIDTFEALSKYSRSKASSELHLGPGTIRRLSVEMAKVGLSFAE